MPRTETSMVAWGRGLEKAGVADVGMVEALKADRFKGWKRVEQLGLPRYELKTSSLDSFLENFAEIIPKDEKRDWFVLLEPRKGGMRYRKTLLKSSEIVDFVETTVSDNNLDASNYDIAISESLPQEYGGNIIIDKNGKILAEISKGGQGVVAEGTHDQEKHGNLFTVRRDQFLGSFKYSWEDGEETNGVALRAAVNKTIMSIPHEGEDREIKFTPGYYEFHLVRKDGEEGLQPVFVDCRQDEVLTKLPSDF